MSMVIAKKYFHYATVFAAIVWCVSYVLPNHYFPWLSFHQEIVNAVAFLPLMLYAITINKNISPLTGSVFGLSLIPILQCMFGLVHYWGDAWIATLYIGGFACATHIGFSFAKDREIENRVFLIFSLWIGLIISGIISVGIQLHQSLQLERLSVLVVELPPGVRASGNLAQSNHLSTLLMLGVMGVVYLSEIKKISAIIAMTTVSWLTLGVVLAESRTALLIMIWLLPWYFLIRKNVNIKLSFIGVAYFVILYFALHILWPLMIARYFQMDGIDKNIHRILEGPVDSIRLILWKSMLQAALQKPWVGYGWGQMGFAQWDTALYFVAPKTYFNSSHNFILDLIIWNGAPIAAFVVVWFFWWSIFQIRNCKNNLSFVLLTSVFIVLSHAMVEYPLQYSYFLLPVGLWMGMLSVERCGIKASNSLLSLKAKVIVVKSSMIAVMVLFIMVVFEYFQYEEGWERMQFREANIEDIRPEQMRMVFVLTHLDALMRSLRMDVDEHISQEQLNELREATIRFPLPKLMYKYALAQAFRGDLSSAAETLKRFCKMQSDAVCVNAQREWSLLSQKKYPWLKEVEFMVKK